MPTSPPDVSTQVIEPTARLELDGVDVVVVEGPDRGVSRRLGPGGIRIGTGAASELALTDPTVSPLHCPLEFVGRSIRVSDSGSTNGTFVDGVRVLAAELAPGARLK